MYKTLFDIQSDGMPDGETVLLMEAGQDYCSAAFWHRQTATISALQFYSFNELEAEETLSALIEKLNERKFNSVVVSSGFPQALLVPAKYFTGDYAALDTVYEQPVQAYRHDAIPEWQLVIMYALPKAIHQLLEEGFSTPAFFHAYTPSIKVYNGYVADNQLSVYFTPQHFRVLLKKETAIQLIQTYSYHTPLDVIYYLLKICHSFELEQEAVHLILSGLLDKDSSLFKELEQYFTNVHFEHLPQLKLPQSSHPPYFFNPLYNLAACVL